MALKKIDIGKLQVGMQLADPVYAEKNNRRILLMAPNTLVVNKSQIRQLVENGVREIVIDTEKGIDTFNTLLDQKKWGEISDSARSKGASEAIVKRHVNTFVDAVTSTISRNFTSRILIRSDSVLALTKDVMFFVEDNIDILLAFIRMRGINEYTFTHSVNTMVLAISVADSLNIKYNDIKRFGIGALLADIGMTNYPSKLLSRPSGLSKAEIDEIKKHPTYTVEFLRKNGIEDHLIETIVTQHHERFDGSGYPSALNGDEIHLISRLFAIADVYDAMTSARPHRSGIPPYKVLAEILKLSGTQFDPAVSRVFIKHVGVFPVGSMVELTSGKLGLVVEQRKPDPLRPLVIVFNTKKKLQSADKTPNGDPGVIIGRAGWELTDLSEGEKNDNGKIKRGLDHRDFRINPEYYLNNV